MSETKSLRATLAIACVAAFFTSSVSNAEGTKTNQNTINEANVQAVDADALQAKLSDLKEQATLKIKLFSTTLTQALMAALKEGGVSSGIEVCHSEAPKIGASLSVDGWIIKRTSLKTRNTENAPDEWEQSILNQFQTEFTNGNNINTLVESSYDNESFRFMKAIPTGPICMGCHGSYVDQKTLEKISALYPNDNAIDFSIGDLRGAFSAEKAGVE